MTKKLHIHVHRNRTTDRRIDERLARLADRRSGGAVRDAGEGDGKGKWVTLSPSGTHVKLDGEGNVTAGPKGLSLGKKGSASPAAKKAPAKKEVPAIATRHSNRGAPALAQLQAQSNAHLKATGHGHLVKPAKNAPGTGTPSPAKHDPSGMAHPGIPQGTAAVTPPGFPTPGSQAGNKVRVNQATGELSQVGRVNPSSGPDEDALRARVTAAREGMRKATNKAEEQRQEMFFEEAMEKLAALQESTRRDMVHPGRNDRAEHFMERAQAHRENAEHIKSKYGRELGLGKPGPDGKPTALPGVSAFSPPKSTSAQISASMVTYRSNTTGAGTAPKDKSQYGNWLFDSAPGSLADHSRTGGTFAISGTYAEAEQKAKQQAAAWGHSQLRLAP